MMQLWSLFMLLLLVELTTVPRYLLAFPLVFWGDQIEFYARLLGLLDGFLSSLLSLHTCVMCCIGCLCLSGSHIALLLWFLVVFLAALHLTCAIFAAQCLMLQRVGCFVLPRGVSSLFHGLAWLLDSAVLFRLWALPSEMSSHLRSVFCF